MRTVCGMYNTDFQNLHETHEPPGGEYVDESVDLPLCNPPYGGPRQQNHQNSDHVVFNSKDMDAFCYFAEYVLKRRGSKHIYSPAIQFALWSQFLRARVEDVQKSA